MGNRAKKAEEKRLKEIELLKEKHKCNACEWGTLENNKIYCPWSTCIKEKGG